MTRVDADPVRAAAQLDEELDVAAERGIGGVGRAGPHLGPPPDLRHEQLRVQTSQLDARQLGGRLRWSRNRTSHRLARRRRSASDDAGASVSPLRMSVSRSVRECGRSEGIERLGTRDEHVRPAAPPASRCRQPWVRNGETTSIRSTFRGNGHVTRRVDAERPEQVRVEVRGQLEPHRRRARRRGPRGRRASVSRERSRAPSPRVPAGTARAARWRPRAGCRAAPSRRRTVSQERSNVRFRLSTSSRYAGARSRRLAGSG